MNIPRGFKAVKQAVIAALQQNRYTWEERGNSIDTKNLLATGAVSSATVAAMLMRCKGSEHQTSPHHVINSVEVHVIKTQGWYIKFYFLDADPDTVFISVHQ